MREILFRGKDKKGIWHYGLPMHGCLKNQVTQIQSFNVELDGFYVHEVIPETVSQFTEYTDKNGKKIFEGDVVHCRDKKDAYGIVKYGEFENQEDPDDKIIGFYIDDGTGCASLALTYEGVRFTDVVDVCGNVWDNPELIAE